MHQSKVEPEKRKQAGPLTPTQQQVPCLKTLVITFLFCSCLLLLIDLVKAYAPSAARLDLPQSTSHLALLHTAIVSTLA